LGTGGFGFVAAAGDFPRLRFLENRGKSDSPNLVEIGLGNTLERISSTDDPTVGWSLLRRGRILNPPHVRAATRNVHGKRHDHSHVVPRLKGGFSLLEVMLVLFLLSLFLMLGSTRLEDFLRSSRMDGAVRAISQTIAYARSLAATGGQDLYLHLDLKNARYWLSQDASLLSEPGPREDLAELHYLPVSVRFRDVITLGSGMVSEGRATIRFTPQGLVEPADIHLVEDNLETMTLFVDPVRGIVRVQEGYVVREELG